jgi:hypothetical protein
VHEWILQQDLIYFRAITHLPQDMVNKMEPRYRRMFEPMVLPTATELRLSIYKSLRFYHNQFGVVMPKLNVEPMLYGYVYELGCPRKYALKVPVFLN